MGINIPMVLERTTRGWFTDVGESAADEAYAEDLPHVACLKCVPLHGTYGTTLSSALRVIALKWNEGYDPDKIQAATKNSHRRPLHL
jgi:hypothetical protein